MSLTDTNIDCPMIESRPNIVAASLLAADFSCFADEVAAVEQAGVDWLHVDVMDGHFVPIMAITAPTVKALRPRTSCPLDVHLMIEQPARHLETFAEAGADYLSVHFESDDHIHRTLGEIRRLGMRAGLALNPGTSLEVINALLGRFDLLLIMTVNPGFGGQAFLHDQLDKIRAARILLDRHFSSRGECPLISVDGGINAETAELCRKAGADVFGAGSGIFGAPASDYAKRIAAIRGKKHD